MSGEEKLGLLANLERCKAQQTLLLGLYDPTNYQAVYDLYLRAYGNEALAQRAKSAATERFVDASTRTQRERQKA